MTRAGTSPGADERGQMRNGISWRGRGRGNPRGGESLPPEPLPGYVLSPPWWGCHFMWGDPPERKGPRTHDSNRKCVQTDTPSVFSWGMGPHLLPAPTELPQQPQLPANHSAGPCPLPTLRHQGLRPRLMLDMTSGDSSGLGPGSALGSSVTFCESLETPLVLLRWHLPPVRAGGSKK